MVLPNLEFCNVFLLGYRGTQETTMHTKKKFDILFRKGTVMLHLVDISSWDRNLVTNPFLPPIYMETPTYKPSQSGHKFKALFNPRMVLY